ncbi:MAG TPA: response regulator [candidate division Zixibacteria bacterium]|nr:response regulator [candidate division Zixibacteria bacterium]
MNKQQQEAGQRITEHTDSATAVRTMPRILVAEDDPEMRRLLVWNLRKEGFETVECSDGWELLDHLGKPVLDGDPDDFDLVVSDIRMPGATGLEVLEGINETEWFVPMILITAFGSDQVHREAEELGAAGIFDKPFEVQDLIERIRQVLVLDSPLGHNWKPAKRPAAAELGIDVVFDHMEPIQHIERKVHEAAAILRDINYQILYSRAVITGPSPGRPLRYHVQIMVTLPDRVFVVRSNLKSIKSEEELNAAIPLAFEITLGKIKKFLASRPD